MQINVKPKLIVFMLVLLGATIMTYRLYLAPLFWAATNQSAITVCELFSPSQQTFYDNPIGFLIELMAFIGLAVIICFLYFFNRRRSTHQTKLSLK